MSWRAGMEVGPTSPGEPRSCASCGAPAPSAPSGTGLAALEECARCGHVAPRIDATYPRLASSREAREHLFSRRDHAPTALRFLYVAQLHAGSDPREEATWVLRAAQADADAGLADRAEALRRRSRSLLDERAATEPTPPPERGPAPAPAGASPRYLAAHRLLPAHLRERGAAAVLDAIERGDGDFFIPVWMQAGFRFTPMMFHSHHGGHRVGVVTLPMPRAATEAYLAAIVAPASAPARARYFVWERSEPAGGGPPGTMIGEWDGATRRNFGAGPPFTGSLHDDVAAFVARVGALCATS